MISNRIRTVFVALATATVFGAALATVQDTEAKASRRSVITPAVFSAAKFCDRKPDADIPYSLMTACTRLALTTKYDNGSTAFPDGRVLIDECISEAHAPDSGHTRNLRERQAFITECFRSAGR